MKVAFAFLVIGTVFILDALFWLRVTFAGGVERELFDSDVSPILLGLNWLFTFDVTSISMTWYAGLICLLIGVVLIFRKKRA